MSYKTKILAFNQFMKDVQDINNKLLDNKIKEAEAITLILAAKSAFKVSIQK